MRNGILSSILDSTGQPSIIHANAIALSNQTTLLRSRPRKNNLWKDGREAGKSTLKPPARTLNCPNLRRHKSEQHGYRASNAQLCCVSQPDRARAFDKADCQAKPFRSITTKMRALAHPLCLRFVNAWAHHLSNLNKLWEIAPVVLLITKSG